MAPPSFRLESVAALLIQRLEASRLAWLGDSARAQEEIHRITAEMVGGVARECRESTGDEVQAQSIEREVLATFVPRYARIALAQNARERGKVDSLALRGALVVGGVIAAVVLERLGLWVWLFPMIALVYPELQVAWTRRGYTAELQQIVQDMAELQQAVERVPPAIPEKMPTERPHRTAQKETI
jgi:hypothetical protein